MNGFASIPIHSNRGLLGWGKNLRVFASVSSAESAVNFPRGKAKDIGGRRIGKLGRFRVSGRSEIKKGGFVEDGGLAEFVSSGVLAATKKRLYQLAFTANDHGGETSEPAAYRYFRFCVEPSS